MTGREWSRDGVRLIHGDCLEVLPTLEAGSVDAIISDPPYPEIDRSYGRMTEAEWWSMMMGVCRESRRILKPTGSAMFVLQPNSAKVGSMRGWLWRFMAWACDEWNMVQDAWWWNHSTPPCGGATTHGMMRGSLKACVWLGPADCYRDQSSVLGPTSAKHRTRIEKYAGVARSGTVRFPSGGNSMDYARAAQASLRRGGTTPFNVIQLGFESGPDLAASHGHGAGTPMNLADWWVRYLCPPGGTVLDPFSGSGTIPLSAAALGRKATGIERDPGYFETGVNRFERPHAPRPRRRIEAEPTDYLWEVGTS
jgi:hypothetical protein